MASEHEDEDAKCASHELHTEDHEVYNLSEQIRNHTLNPKSSSSAEHGNQSRPKKPTIVLVIGMAGSGKTKLVQRINAWVHQKEISSYLINLDPAVLETPFEANIDIRDVVNYKQIMKEHGLGPNGGIITCLNLFATRFHQVMDIIEQRADEVDYIFIDTPGQIEVFTWSASGQIITEALASTYPTCMMYVVDTPRCEDPITFMSNMTYACSMLYKTCLPFLLAFNKADISNPGFAINWMNNLEDFNHACSADNTYMSSLTKDLGLAMCDFYENIEHVGVSAITGLGMPELFKKFEICKELWYTEYQALLQSRIKRNQEIRKQKELAKLRMDGVLTKNQTQI